MYESKLLLILYKAISEMGFLLLVAKSILKPYGENQGLSLLFRLSTKRITGPLPVGVHQFHHTDSICELTWETNGHNQI